MTPSARYRRPAAVLMPAVLLALSACSGSGGGSAAPTGPSLVQAGDLTATDAATGDVSNVTWYGDYRPPYTLDPLKVADYPEETVIPNLCEPLVRVADDYTLQPGLAASWTSPDPLSLVLTLRQGVQFTDGQPMTSEDVAYSLNRNLDPAVASAYGYSFGAVTSITATAPDTVTVSFSSPSPQFIDTLATLAGSVVEQSFAEQAGDSFGSPETGVVCTGPFALDSFDGSSELVMSRNEGYWDTGNRAHADTFTFVYPADPTALLNGFTSGQIDGGFNLPSTLLGDLSQASGGTVYLGGEGSTPINIDLLVSRPDGPLADTRVRQALSMALDREAIAATVFQNAADPLYLVSGPGTWTYAEEAFDQAYVERIAGPDVEAARQLVQDADAEGETIRFAYPTGDPQSQQLATVVQQTAQEIGLDLQITGLPNQQFGSLFVDPAAREPFDLFITKNYVELPDPLKMDLLYGLSTGLNNYSGYSNAQFDQALNEALATADDAMRAELVIEAEDQLAIDLPAIPVVQPRSVVYQADGLTGAPLTFAFMTAPWAAGIGAP